MSKLSPDQWQALSPRLDEALEMTDDERSSWLSSLQSENPTLAYQLEILLRESLPPTARGAHEAVFPVDMPELGSRSGGRTARTSAHHLSFPALRRGVD